MPFSLNLYQISVVGVVGSENRRGGKSGIYRTQIKKKKEFPCVLLRASLRYHIF